MMDNDLGRSVPDGLSSFGSSQQAVSPVPASIPSAGSVAHRFTEPLKFARYYIVEALEVQENSDLRDALVTLDWLIDGDEV